MNALKAALLSTATAVAFLIFINAVHEPAYARIRALNKQMETAMPGADIRQMNLTQTYYKLVSVGFKELIADYFWIKALTFKAVDEMENLKLDPSASDADFHSTLESLAYEERDYQKAYRLLRQTVFFDPNFVYAYQYGSLILAWSGHVELSNSLLRLGLKNNPDEWRLASSLAFNSYFFQHDYEAAVKWAKRNGEISGEDNAGLIANLYLRDKKFEMALTILDDLLDRTEDEVIRRSIEEKIQYVLVERDIYFLEDAVQQMRIKVGRDPESLQDLVKADLIREIPKEPFGGVYSLTDDFQVVNKPARRLKIMQRLEEEEGPETSPAMRMPHVHDEAGHEEHGREGH